MLWRRLGFLRLTVFTLGISGAAGNDAAAVLALHDPGGRQSTNFPNSTGEESANIHPSGICFSATLGFMCGRYRLTARERYLRDHFGLDDDVPWTPRWNIAPTQQVAVIG